MIRKAPETIKSNKKQAVMSVDGLFHRWRWWYTLPLSVLLHGLIWFSANDLPGRKSSEPDPVQISFNVVQAPKPPPKPVPVAKQPTPQPKKSKNLSGRPQNCFQTRPQAGDDTGKTKPTP